MKQDLLWKIMRVLSMIGIVLATYLFYNFLSTNPLQTCYINSSVNCDAVTKGPIATVLGIPVSLIGLIGYFTILYASFVKNKKLALFMTSFGMVFCLRLTILEIFFIKVICPVCLVCQTIMLIVFLISVKLMRTKDSF